MIKKVLIVAAEIYPFAKVGGLADVVGALPKALDSMDIDVRLIMPFYGDIQAKAGKFKIKPTDIKNRPITIGENTEHYDIYESRVPGTSVPVYFIKSKEYFDREGIYLDPETKKDFPDQSDRWIFYAKAVLDAIPTIGFHPDIIHVNDHHTALIPAYIKLSHSSHQVWSKAASLLTIHNLAYQGVFARDILNSMGLGQELFYPTGPFEFYGDVNLLKIGTLFADAVNTVSPTYAEEIKTVVYGEKMDGVLLAISQKLFGIINGVDYSVWSPAVDKNLEYKYSHDDLSGKRMMKSVLLREYKLPEDLDTPLIGMIGRMAKQKGFDLVQKILPELVKLNAKLIVLGSGKTEYEDMFKKAMKKYPNKVGAYIGFNGPLAHKIEAGADIFLMPSRFEPCGLNQMYSLKYGTPPVVRKTGGLADTVIDASEFPNRGTGFVFDKYKPQAFLNAIKRAISAYMDRKRWREIVLRGMKIDYSWNTSARKYLELYTKAIEFKNSGK